MKTVRFDFSFEQGANTRRSVNKRNARRDHLDAHFVESRRDGTSSRVQPVLCLKRYFYRQALKRNLSHPFHALKRLWITGRQKALFNERINNLNTSFARGIERSHVDVMRAFRREKATLLDNTTGINVFTR